MTGLQMIKDKRAAIARQRAALEKQDADLAIAEKVMAELEGANAPPPQEPFQFGVPTPATSRRARVLEALGGEKVWMTSAEVNAAIYKRHGAFIKGPSFFPMLSLLKKEQVIIREGDKVALRSRVEGGSAVTT